MDIYCPLCGEPWDLDSIHGEISRRYPGKPWRDIQGEFLKDVYSKKYNEVRDELYTQGCKALGGICSKEKDEVRAGLTSALIDILGDDIGGIAAELEDAEFFGLL